MNPTKSACLLYTPKIVRWIILQSDAYLGRYKAPSSLLSTVVYFSTLRSQANPTLPVPRVLLNLSNEISMCIARRRQFVQENKSSLSSHRLMSYEPFKGGGGEAALKNFE